MQKVVQVEEIFLELGVDEISNEQEQQQKLDHKQQKFGRVSNPHKVV